MSPFYLVVLELTSGWKTRQVGLFSFTCEFKEILIKIEVFQPASFKIDYALAANVITEGQWTIRKLRFISVTEFIRLYLILANSLKVNQINFTFQILQH